LSEKEKEDEILKLIRFVDRNKSNMFKWFDVFRGEIIYPLMALLYFFGIVWFFLTFSTADVVYKIIIASSFLSFMVGFFSLFARFFEENVLMVNFKRFEKCVKENEKPLLKALIKIKVKNREFDLEQIYNMNKSMFIKEKLLERLYE